MWTPPKDPMLKGCFPRASNKDMRDMRGRTRLTLSLFTLAGAVSVAEPTHFTTRAFSTVVPSVF